jgi:hypothetical protein
MWPYLQTFVPLMHVVLASAICVNVVSFIAGHSKPQARTHGVHPKQINCGLFVRKSGTVFSALPDSTGRVGLEVLAGGFPSGSIQETTHA